MNKPQRVVQIRSLTQTLLFFGIALGFVALGLFFPEMPFYLLLLLTEGFLLGAERSYVNYLQAAQITEKRFDDTRQGMSSDLARLSVRWHKALLLPRTIIGVLLSIFIFALWIGAIFLIAQPTPQFTPTALAAPLAFVLHFLILRPLFIKSLRGKWQGAQERALPQLTISGDDLVIDIAAGAVIIGSKNSAPAPIRIPLKTVTRMQELNFQEVESLKEFEIGPDLQLYAQSKIDEINYWRRKLDRPNTYFSVVNNPTLSHITIQAPDLFYVFSAPQTQVQQVLRRWEELTNK